MRTSGSRERRGTRARRPGSRHAGARAVVAIAILAGAAALLLASAAQPQPRAGGPRLATCFWEGPISTKRPTTRGFDGRNFNFPEESATYWLARFNLPQGSHLRLRGRYPHGRYMSLNSYSGGAPTDALSDIVIRPLPGSTNPFIAGHRRDLPRRGWSVAVHGAEARCDGDLRAGEVRHLDESGDGRAGEEAVL